MFSLKYVFFILTLVMLLTSCQSDERNLREAQQTFNVESFARHVQKLSSDEFEGRAPASDGEEKTVSYLQSEFERLGVRPGNGESYFQEVPLVALTTDSPSALKIRGGSQDQSFTFTEDFMAWTKRVVGNSAIQASELVFVGYGVVAPEYDWNDYRDIDVKGKTVVMLVNDPGFGSQQPELFNGNAMTYYGRWTYKFEEAARQGAAGAFIIHEENAAGYPWEVVSGSWSGKQFDLVNDDNNMSRCAIEGWLTWGAAVKLFEQAGVELEESAVSAHSPGFKPFSLGCSASVSVKNNIEHSRSKNVIALLPGREKPEEVIIYTAHWDHFGKVPGMDGDNIFNGAFDNATGTAALIELAEAFLALKSTPRRSIVLLAVTAEEQGLLGSRFYATNPIYPVNKTVAAINIDGMNVYGRMKDITIVGYGNSELDDYVLAAARSQNRVVRPDPEPQKGYFYRSDHFNFAKVGIPALYTDNGIDHIEHGPDWTQEQHRKYTAERYHKPSDEYDPNWDLSGAIDDMQILFEVGYKLSNADYFPNWREGNEFKARRDADMAVQATSSQAGTQSGM